METLWKVGDWLRVKGKPRQIVQIDNKRYEAECECEEDIVQTEYLLHNGMIITKDLELWSPIDGELVSVQHKDEFGVYAVVRAYDGNRSEYFKDCEPFVNEKPSFVAGPAESVTLLKPKSIFNLQSAVDSLAESKKSSGPKIG